MEKALIMESDTPSALRPGAVKATCIAVEGKEGGFTALVIGADRNQDRAASASFTLIRK